MLLHQQVKKLIMKLIKKFGPYVFRICGQNHHVIGSLLPNDGEKSKSAQLYIFDTENETNNRISSFLHDDSSKNINSFIVEGLIKMFDEINVLAKSFRMARDRFVEDDMLPVKLKLLGRRHNDSSQYSVPSSSEIAGLIVGDYGLYDKKRDIIVEYKTNRLKRVSVLHPCLMAMQYPILFPYGEDGYMTNIKYINPNYSLRIARKYVTMREYYAHKIQ